MNSDQAITEAVFTGYIATYIQYDILKRFWMGETFLDWGWMSINSVTANCSFLSQDFSPTFPPLSQDSVRAVSAMKSVS